MEQRSIRLFSERYLGSLCPRRGGFSPAEGERPVAHQRAKLAVSYAELIYVEPLAAGEAGVCQFVTRESAVRLA